MTETIYWITRLDAIKEGWEVTFVISTVTAVFSLIGALIACETPEILRPVKRLLTASTITAIVAGIGYILTPTLKEGVIIHACNVVKEYYESNDKAKGLPDKLVDKIYDILEEDDNE